MNGMRGDKGRQAFSEGCTYLRERGLLSQSLQSIIAYALSGGLTSLIVAFWVRSHPQAPALHRRGCADRDTYGGGSQGWADTVSAGSVEKLSTLCKVCSLMSAMR